MLDRNTKRVVRWLLASALVILTAALAGSAFAGIANSKHDFSSGGKGGNWGTTQTDQICIFCHTPHNAQIGQGQLWNRAANTATFKTYSSSSLNAVTGQPTGTSKLCLSCHDGSTAIDAYVAGKVGAPSMMAIGDVYYPGSPYGAGAMNIGGNYSGNPNVNDLRNDHPISFTYDDALAAADTGIKAPAAIPSSLPLQGGKMECSTCHDVHNTLAVAGTRLLRVTPEGSALCLSCHLK